MDHSNGSFWKICHNENELQKAVELLKEEAFVLGYPVFLGSEDPSNFALLKHLINFSWNLSREVKRHRADKRDMQQNQLHQSQTNEQSQKRLVMLQNKIDVLEKQNKKLHNELQNANSCKLAATEESLKVKKNVDELRKVIEFNNNQYNINLEKKILELRSLQNKYENYCKTGKRNTDRKGFENDQNKCNANDKYKNLELVEKAHRKIVSSLEQTVEKLVEENLTLRRFLEKLGRLIFDVNTRISSLKGSQLENEELDILDDLFQLSCEEIKEAIDSYFGSTVQNIVSTFQELLNQLSQQSSSSQ